MNSVPDHGSRWFLGIRGQVILLAGLTLVLTALTFTLLQLRQFEHMQAQIGRASCRERVS
jgi:hypothetical protein